MHLLFITIIFIAKIKTKVYKRRLDFITRSIDFVEFGNDQLIKFCRIPMKYNNSNIAGRCSYCKSNGHKSRNNGKYNCAELFNSVSRIKKYLTRKREFSTIYIKSNKYVECFFCEGLKYYPHHRISSDGQVICPNFRKSNECKKCFRTGHDSNNCFLYSNLELLFRRYNGKENCNNCFGKHHHNVCKDNVFCKCGLIGHFGGCSYLDDGELTSIDKAETTKIEFMKFMNDHINELSGISFILVFISLEPNIYLKNKVNLFKNMNTLAIRPTYLTTGLKEVNYYGENVNEIDFWYSEKINVRYLIIKKVIGRKIEQVYWGAFCNMESCISFIKSRMNLIIRNRDFSSCISIFYRESSESNKEIIKLIFD